jgi:S1-C subfamily serine protease
MEFITNLFVSAIVAYVSFTNQLADGVLALLNINPYDAVESTLVEEAPSLPSLPSLFGSQTIPDILLKSQKYQQAAVAGSVSLGTVNIYCTFTTPTTIRTTTGTGYFIHSDGVIITNAHVAQYLLLESTKLLGEADCIIRQGDPAETRYRAELLYIPPAWVEKNAEIIDAAVPTGTGERDYALLYVTESLTEAELPTTFPALAFDTELMPHNTTGKAVVAAGYPATDLLARGAGTPLIPRKAETAISELYTFGSNYADVFSLKGTVVGAEGSSGGPITDTDATAIGLIATRGDDAIDGPGSLRAITLSHVHRTILEETGFSLERNVSGDIAYRADVFKETMAPFLIDLFATELGN